MIVYDIVVEFVRTPNIYNITRIRIYIKAFLQIRGAVFYKLSLSFTIILL